jgi:phage-related minor tail protein
LGHGEEENMEEGIDAFVSDINGKEADETALENSEWTGTEEGSARVNQEDQNSSGSTNRGKNDVDAKRDTTCDEVGSESLSGDEVVIKATSDSTGEVSNRGERELPTERSTCEDHRKASIMEEKDTTARISKTEHVPSPLETTCGVTKSAEAPTSIERENMTRADSTCEKDKGSSQRVQEKKENERRLAKERELAEEKERRKLEKERELAEEMERMKLEKEKELAEEKERRKLEKERELAEEKERRKLEEAERERERKKDRLAVERATREAHERAFAEAREKAEKMALERITAARQRASAEAREKEERASVQATAERATREARIKAERAAVERATAEARERAIEKAKAEKALAEARERRERYKSSFKESFKSTNQVVYFVGMVHCVMQFENSDSTMQPCFLFVSPF